jgi:hypothetical protein
MTDEQFERLMQKLEEIEREMKKPDSPYKFVQPLPPPAHPYDGLPPQWILPRVTD